jgi:hypothetical protein
MAGSNPSTWLAEALILGFLSLLEALKNAFVTLLKKFSRK